MPPRGPTIYEELPVRMRYFIKCTFLFLFFQTTPDFPSTLEKNSVCRNFHKPSLLSLDPLWFMTSCNPTLTFQLPFSQNNNRISIRIHFLYTCQFGKHGNLHITYFLITAEIPLSDSLCDTHIYHHQYLELEFA